MLAKVTHSPLPLSSAPGLTLGGGTGDIGTSGSSTFDEKQKREFWELWKWGRLEPLQKKRHGSKTHELNVPYRPRTFHEPLMPPDPKARPALGQGGGSRDSAWQLRPLSSLQPYPGPRAA